MKPRAFTLLEVLFAIALFGVAAIALSQTLHQIGVAALDAAEATRRLQHLDSHLVEALHQGRLTPGEETISLEGEDFHLIRNVQNANLSNEDGEALSGILEVIIRAVNAEGETLDSISTLYYSPGDRL